MTLQIFTDGGSRGNPGPAAIGYIAYLDGKEVFRGREDIGTATNNEAEYTAVTRALEKVKDKKDELQNVGKIEVRSDSRLLVNQVNGLFKVKHGKIKEHILAIRTLEQEIGTPISYINVPREENTVADDLVNNKLGG